LDGESKRSSEAQKLAKKNERRMKELQFQGDEDAKNLSRALENADRLNSKNKKVRVAVEEAVC
jgi:translation initiation factor IF-3